jgi:hypothetical protein
VLGQKSLHDALTYDTALLHAVAPQFKTYAVAAPAGVAQLTTPWGQRADLTAAKPIKVFGYPGMPLHLEAKLTRTGLPIERSQAVASLSVSAGEATETVALTSSQAVQAPGLMWRLIR